MVWLKLSGRVAYSGYCMQMTKVRQRRISNTVGRPAVRQACSAWPPIRPNGHTGLKPSSTQCGLAANQKCLPARRPRLLKSRCYTHVLHALHPARLAPFDCMPRSLTRFIPAGFPRPQLVSDAGHGGMLLLSGDAWAALHGLSPGAPAPASGGLPEELAGARALHCGRYRLQDGREAAQLGAGPAEAAAARGGGEPSHRCAAVVTDVYQVRSGYGAYCICTWGLTGCTVVLSHNSTDTGDPTNHRGPQLAGRTFSTLFYLLFTHWGLLLACVSGACPHSSFAKAPTCVAVYNLHV